MSIDSIGRGMSVASCDDNPQCNERFRSGSIKGVLRAQLEAAEWEVVVDRSKPGGLRTICKWHKNSRTTGPTAIRMPDKRKPDGA